MKCQLIISCLSKRILDIRLDVGSKHDFKLFKETYNDLKINKNTIIIGDNGYQGMEKIHSNSLTPCKKPYKCNNFNKTISQLKIYVEHVVRELKKFSIIGNTNREKGNRLRVRVGLISGIYNWGR